MECSKTYRGGRGVIRQSINPDVTSISSHRFEARAEIWQVHSTSECKKGCRGDFSNFVLGLNYRVFGFALSTVAWSRSHFFGV